MHFLDRFLEETLNPLMGKYLTQDDYYFINDEGQKTFNSGKVMFEEREIFHPLLAPFTDDCVVAFYVDDAPLIYADRRLFEDQETLKFMSLDWEFVYDLHKDRFFNSEGKSLRTEIVEFDAPEFFQLKKEVTR